MQQLNTPQPAMPTQSFLQVPQGPQAQACQGAQAMQVIPAVVPPTGQYAAPVVPAQFSFGGAGVTNLTGLVAGGVCYVLILDLKFRSQLTAIPIVNDYSLLR